MIGNITDITSKILGPLAGAGSFASLAKKVNNMTTFVVIHKEQFAGKTIPQLQNPYQCKELLVNPVWEDAANIQKPETLQLFTFNSSEKVIMTEEEKAKLKAIANNPNLPISEKLLENIEKSLESASGFLDKRSFFQEKFAGIFDMINQPLSALGIKLLPSDILGTGILGTAFGVAALDAKYLSKSGIISPTTQETPLVTDTKIDETKKIQILAFDEAKVLATKVFGAGPATDLLIAMSGASPAMIQRVVALGRHEGGLKFGRKNEDPNKASRQINIGTFQLSAQKGEIVKKYNDALDAGMQLLKDRNIPFTASDFKKITNYEEETASTAVGKAQCDLLSWLGYVSQSTDGGAKLEDLADAELTSREVKKLMPRIQGGINEIGKGVVDQVADAKVADYLALSNLA